MQPNDRDSFPVMKQDIDDGDMCDPFPAIEQSAPDDVIAGEDFLPAEEGETAADQGKRDDHPRGSAGVDTQSALQNSEQVRQLLQHESSSLEFYKKGFSMASTMCGRPSRYGEVVATKPGPPRTCTTNPCSHAS